MFRRRGGSIYLISVLLHAGAAFAVAHIKREEIREPTRISIQEVRKPKAPPKVEATPPPAPPPEQPKHIKKVAAPAPVPEVAAAPAEVPTFDLTLSGGVGVAASSGGIAVPTALSATAPAKAPAIRTAAPRALVPVKPKQALDCLEALIKPKPISIPQPTYADRAREAGIQGKVRVELTVDATGTVVGARVLESLGYGLDEAALEAAKAARFEPATLCGKATGTTFVIGIRFTL